MEQVQGLTYMDTAWVSRVDLLECFQLWPEGIEIAKAICKKDYGLSSDDANSAAGGDGMTRVSTSEVGVVSQTLPRDALVATLRHMRQHDHVAFDNVMKDVYTQ